MQIWLYWLYWQFWTDLIQSDQKVHKTENLMIYFNDYFIRNQIWFDPFWTDLIQSDQKKLKIENLMIYFNDYVIINWKCGKSGKFGESVSKSQKSILRAFARTRAKNYYIRQHPSSVDRFSEKTSFKKMKEIFNKMWETQK